MSRSRGMTLTEILLGMAILSVFGLTSSYLLKVVFNATTKTQAASSAQEEVRQALSKMESDLYEANEIRTSSTTFVEFICDFNRSPKYDPAGDQDGDGIPNVRDADMDGDANLMVPATAQWRIGFNLKDDDDNGDKKIDVRIRYYLQNKVLYKDSSFDEEAWGARVVKILDNVSLFSINYLGSKANDLGRNIDLGSDGNPGTGDNGENDGIISQVEMDMVPPSAGMGNRDGFLDTTNERRYITSIRLILGVDKNKDGQNDFQVTTEIYPPLLTVKNQ